MSPGEEEGLSIRFEGKGPRINGLLTERAIQLESLKRDQVELKKEKRGGNFILHFSRGGKTSNPRALIIGFRV